MQQWTPKSMQTCYTVSIEKSQTHFLPLESFAHTNPDHKLTFIENTYLIAVDLFESAVAPIKKEMDYWLLGSVVK